MRVFLSSFSIAVLLMVLMGCTADDRLGIHRSALTPDYPQATWDAAYSGNYSVGRQKGFQPSFVIIHVAEGYYNGTISWFKDPQSGVSTHYVVSTNGDVTQMVQETDTAFQVGHGISVVAIGIEHEGFVADPTKWFTDAMYTGSAKLVKNIAERWGIPLDRCHILGHNEVPDPSNPCTYGGSEHHTDPGSGWDWAKYMSKMGSSNAACNWNCNSTVGSLVGVVRSGGLLPSNPVVSGAKVSIGSKSTTTDSKGFYRFDNLNLDYYFPTTVTAAGYKSATQNQAVVVPVDHYNNFALAPGGPPPPDSGTVVADSQVPAGDTGGIPQSDSQVQPGSDSTINPPPGDSGTAPTGDGGGTTNDGEGDDGGCSLASSSGSAAIPVLILCLAVCLLILRRNHLNR